MRNIIKHNDDFNEWTNNLLYKNISLSLYSRKVMFLVCERWVGDGDRLLYRPQSSSGHSSTSSSSWLGCSTVGHWGPKALCLPLALTSASSLQLTQAICALVILLFNVHLLSLFFRLFTPVHLLIDGSVKGQYITLHLPDFEHNWRKVKIHSFLWEHLTFCQRQMH